MKNHHKKIKLITTNVLTFGGDWFKIIVGGIL